MVRGRRRVVREHGGRLRVVAGGRTASIDSRGVRVSNGGGGAVLRVEPVDALVGHAAFLMGLLVYTQSVWCIRTRVRMVYWSRRGLNSSDLITPFALTGLYVMRVGRVRSSFLVLHCPRASARPASRRRARATPLRPRSARGYSARARWMRSPCGAQTGTRKTAAFVLPMLERLAERPVIGGAFAPWCSRRSASWPSRSRNGPRLLAAAYARRRRRRRRLRRRGGGAATRCEIVVAIARSPARRCRQGTIEGVRRDPVSTRPIGCSTWA